MDTGNEKSLSNDASSVSSTDSERKVKDIELGSNIEPQQPLASGDISHRLSQEAAAKEEIDNSETTIWDDGPIPDGGYGWIIVICLFISQCATWGMWCTYGVFISWFLEHKSYPGSPVQYAWIAGSGSIAFFISPLTCYICKRLPLRVNLAIAQVIVSLSFVFAGLSTKIWQLTLSQGLMTGVGVGYNFMATQPLIVQWFKKRKAVAMGLSSAGVGFGGLVFSFTTRAALPTHGTRIAYIINGAIVFALLTPTTVLLKRRMHVKKPKFQAIRWQLLRNHGFKLTVLWGFFVMPGFLIPSVSITTYATKGLGLSQAQGAVLQAVLAAGQLVGQPSLGILIDKYGGIKTTSAITLFSGVTCLGIWMFAKCFGPLIVFAFLNGIVGGVFFFALGPILPSIIGLKDVPDAFSVIWLISAPLQVVAVPSAFALNEYSETILHRTGADVFQIGIGLAGGANIIAAIALIAAIRFQRRDKD